MSGATLTAERLYNTAVEFGLKCDPRDEVILGEALNERREAWDKLTSDQKKLFGDRDKAFFLSPYSDTTVYSTGLGEAIQAIYTGINIGKGDFPVIEDINDRRSPDKPQVNFVLGHHPVGQAMTPEFARVMDLQTYLLTEAGLPLNIAWDLLEERKPEIERMVLPIIHEEVPQVAALYELSLGNVHTPADSAVYRYISRVVSNNTNERTTVGKLKELLLEIPQYRNGYCNRTTMQIINGKESSPIGKVHYHLTGGTTGNPKEIEYLKEAGVNTLIVMHMPEEWVKEEVKEHKMNVLVAGHYASDSIGVDLFLYYLQDIFGDLDILTSGLDYVQREEMEKCPYRPSEYFFAHLPEKAPPGLLEGILLE
jgi:hypothetical protein